MAGEPAIDKIATGLQTALAALTGTTDIDRASDDAYGKGELPARNIRHSGTQFEQFDHGSTLHRANFSIDMIAETKDASTIQRRLRDMEADIIAALWADRTLGGLAQDVIPLSSGGDEDVMVDEGATSLSLEILFLTPIGDHRTIIGASGLVP